MNFIFLFFSCLVFSYASNMDHYSQEIVAARCYSKCLQLFIRAKSAVSTKLSKLTNGQTSISPVTNQDMPQLSFVEEMAVQLSVTQQSLRSCLEDTENQCSRQCFKSCTMPNECTCQSNNIGCLIACYYRKEITKEGPQEECPFISNVEENTVQAPISRCPKTCRSKLNCNINQVCCPTETCGLICLQIENLKFPKYTPVPTQSSTQSNIEFDWSETFSNYLKNESPLVFILQTRTCLCKQLDEKLLTPWQTLIMTHRLGAKLNALDNGTIYQFRLAAISPQGTNGFGSISQNLPSIIYKPIPPFPPEHLLEYKWQITDENLFRVEIKWSEPKPSIWRSYEYLLSWMVDHGVIQSGGEPMSSLTQYTKALPESDRSCTIDNLKPSTTYKIQIVTKAEWSGYGEIMSDPSTIYVTTPATASMDHSSDNFIANSENKTCSCPEIKLDQSHIQIKTPFIINGDLKVKIHLEKYADYIIDSYPEICINFFNENNSQNINRTRILYKQTSEITINNLQFNCRYSLEITETSQKSPAITYPLCFCTPPCQKSYIGKGCVKDDASIFPSPRDVKISLFNYDTMTYKVSWESVNQQMLKKTGAPSISKYRVLWAPRKFEPVHFDHYNDIIGFDPIFDLDRSDVRIIQSNITRLLLHNLTKDQLYIVRIQSLALLDNGQLLESHPITIFLPTHGYSELYYRNSKSSLFAGRSLILIVLRLIHQITILVHSY